jgi:hypothetical protein
LHVSRRATVISKQQHRRESLSLFGLMLSMKALELIIIIILFLQKYRISTFEDDHVLENVFGFITFVLFVHRSE